MSFLNYYRMTVTRPGAAFEGLIKEPGKLRLGAYAVLITAVLYTLVYVFLILGGGRPFKPWLDIPLEYYYNYNVFFCAPSMFAGWILAGGVSHLASRHMTDKGSYEGTLSVFGFGIGIASWSTGIHDLISSFLGAVGIINQSNYEIALNSPTVWRMLLWILMAIYLGWMVILFTVGLKTVYNIKFKQALLLGILGFGSYQLFFLIFNR